MAALEELWAFVCMVLMRIMRIFPSARRTFCWGMIDSIGAKPRLVGGAYLGSSSQLLTLQKHGHTHRVTS